eukprot:324267_1
MLHTSSTHRDKNRKHTKKRKYTKKIKHSKKRKGVKKRRRLNSKKNKSRSDADIKGVLVRVLGVGAFALALWLRVRPKGIPESRQSQSKGTSPSVMIDTSQLHRPLNMFSGDELRKLASSHLGYIFDLERSGRYPPEERQFVTELHRAGLNYASIA